MTRRRRCRSFTAVAVLGPMLWVASASCVGAGWIGVLEPSVEDSRSDGPLDQGIVDSVAGSSDDGTATDSSDSNALPELVPHYVTFSAWPDNKPPGDAITFPTVHARAGGSGTYDDPITFGSDATEWPPGTRLYVPYLRRYVVMEDECSSCIEDWQDGKHRIAIWLDSDGTCVDEVTACELTLTRSSADVEANPPAGRPVESVPLFDRSTCSCIQ